MPGAYDDVSELLGVVVDHERRRGRGAQSNASGRYEPTARVAFDDGWRVARRPAAVQDHGARSTPRARSSPATNRPTSASTARSIPIAAASMAASTASRGRRMPISACRPDSISNPSCSSSRKRPSCSKRELSAPGYQPKVIAIGTNTDPYQPIERQLQVMRRILEVLDRAGHPVGIVTKSALVAARHRYSGAHGRAQAGQGGAVGDDARYQARAHDGAARGDADASAGNAAAPVGRRRADHGDGGAGDPSAQRHGDRAHSRSGA